MVSQTGFWVTLIVLIVLFFFVGITISSLYNTKNTYLQGGFVFQLADALTSTATSLTSNITLSSGNSGYYKVDKEIIYVIAGSSGASSSATIVRGTLGTAAAAHKINDKVVEISNNYLTGNLASFKFYNWFDDIRMNFILPGAYIAIAIGLFYVADKGKW
jgi:hypothetical protein